MKKNLMISKAKYAFATAILAVFNFGNAMAQRGMTPDLASGLEDATQSIVEIFDIVANLTLIISALVGLVGGIQVYSKFSSGDPDGGKRIGKWVGGAVFIGLVPTIIRALFIA
jgi:hypothetical protein